MSYDCTDFVSDIFGVLNDAKLLPQGAKDMLIEQQAPVMLDAVRKLIAQAKRGCVMAVYANQAGVRIEGEGTLQSPFRVVFTKPRRVPLIAVRLADALREHIAFSPNTPTTEHARELLKEYHSLVPRFNGLDVLAAARVHARLVEALRNSLTAMAKCSKDNYHTAHVFIAPMKESCDLLVELGEIEEGA